MNKGVQTTALQWPLLKSMIDDLNYVKICDTCEEFSSFGIFADFFLICKISQNHPTSTESTQYTVIR